MIFRIQGRLQKIRKYYHSLLKKPTTRVVTWQELIRSELLSAGNNVKLSHVQSEIFKNSSRKALPMETIQVRESTDRRLAIVNLLHLSVLERVALRLGGVISLGILHRQGFESTEFLLRRCSKHGIILTYAQGYDGYLRCEQCTAQDQSSSIVPYRTSL
jgi:hypothetical protein